jgi:hypothetical protein
MQRHLVIFARQPRLGTVKRRLAREAGVVTALRFHRLTTRRLLRRVAGDPRWRVWLAVTPDRAALRAGRDFGLPLAVWGVRAVPQGGGDLGDRLGRVLHCLPPGPAAIVGTDIPALDSRHVAQAFRALGRADAVLGPADDGGYWLIALRRRPRVVAPFAGVRWGGPHAGADTHANLARAGLRTAWLAPLADVDTAADLRPGQFR